MKKFDSLLKLLGLLGICAVILPAMAAAQEAPNGQEPTFPTVEGVLPGDQGDASHPGDPLTDVNINGPLSIVLDHYERLTGKRLIKDNTLMVNVPQNFSLVIRDRIPLSEAVRLIETMLLLNNIYLIPIDEKTLKVMGQPGGAPKMPKSEAIPLYTDVTDLPKSDVIVSYFMRLSHISPDQAINFFNTHFQPPHMYSSKTPVPHAQALAITDSTSVIRQMVAFKALIDVPPAEMVSEFVQLERADAENVAKILQEVIKARKGGNTQGMPGSPINQTIITPEGETVPVPPPVAGIAPPDKGITGDVQLIADRRTNRILVITPRSNFEYVQKMVHEFDRAVDLIQPLEFQLQHISAAEVLPVLQDILKEEKSGEGASSAPTSSPTSPVASVPTPGGADSGELPSLQAAVQDTSPKSVTVGKTHIIADPRNNSILVSGPPENLQKVRTILKKLDKRPKQVYLSTVIGRFELTDGFEFGLDWYQNFKRVDNNSGIAAGLVNRRADALANVNLGAIGASGLSGLTVIGTLNDSLTVALRALESTSRFKVLSRPSVFTLNNKPAEISSGSEVPVPENILSNLNTGTTNNVSQNATVQFKKVLLKLRVVPLVNSDNEVTLQVAQQNDSLGNEVVISGNEIPTITTQQITTTVTVRNKQTAVMGGLITESRQEIDAGLPWISRIPVIGYLFKNKTIDKVRNELVILIQPTVIENMSDMLSVESEEKARTVILPEAMDSMEPKAPYTPPQTPLKLRYPGVRPNR